MKRKLAASLCLVVSNLIGCIGTVFAQQQTQASFATTQVTKEYPLAGDARLNSKINYRCQKAKISDILTELRTYTSARLTADENWGNITLHVNSISVRDTLDCLGAICYSVWKYEDNKWILSAPKDPLVLDGHRPHRATEAEAFAQGRALLDAADTLPPDLKQRLTDEDRNQKGLSFAELPPEMQKLTQGIYQYDRQNKINMEIPFQQADKWPESLTDCHVRLLTPSQPSDNSERGFTSHTLLLQIDHPNAYFSVLGSQMNFYTFPGPNPDYHVVSYDELEQKETNRLADSYEKFKKSREEALAKDKRLEQTVTLTMEKVSFLTAVQILANTADISFVTKAPSLDTNLRTFRFNRTPLREALDQIVAAYPVKMGVFGDLLPADEKEPVYPVQQPSNVKSMIMVNGKVYTPKPIKPIIMAWGWRKSGVFLFAPMAATQVDAYEAKQKATKSTPTNDVKSLPSSSN